jgi:hypothetical protein
MNRHSAQEELNMMRQSPPARSARPQARVAARLLLGIVLAVSAAACTTTDYRSVQADFNRAVELDNGATVGGNPFAESDYAGIAERLTDERIAALDPRLQANAWLLRAFAEYRLDRLDPGTGALRSQDRGLKAGPKAGSRDDVLLRLIPALVIDRELEIDWVAKNRMLAPVQYDAAEHGESAASGINYERDFMSAVKAVDRAMQAAGPSTPDSAVYYAHYQKWRVLENWRAVIVSIHAGDDSDKLRAEELADAEKLISKGLEAARDAERDAIIPPSHTLRALIRAKGGGG